MQTVIPEGVILSLTAIVASLLIGELHRTHAVLVTTPKWVGVLVNVLRSAAFALFVSALISVLAVCVVATRVPQLDRDVTSPLLLMATGMVVFVLMQCIYTPIDTMAGFSDEITTDDRKRATVASTVPEYLIYLALTAYVVRLIWLAAACECPIHAPLPSGVSA